MSSKEKKSNFKFDEDELSWVAVEFLKITPKSISYFFIIFVFITLVSIFMYMALSDVAITIKAASIVSTKSPLIKATAEFDIKIQEISTRSGQKVEKGEAIIMGDDRIKSENLIKFQNETKAINDFILQLSEGNCSADCIADFRSKFLEYFRYFRNPKLKDMTRKIRELLYKATSLKKEIVAQDLNKVNLLLIDLSEMISIIQKEQIIHAPTSGIIIFTDQLSIGSFLKRGAVIFQIIPEDHSIIIKSYINDKDISKIKMEMQAQISIDAFPARKFGLLTGKVSQIGVTKTKYKNSQDLYEVEVTIEKDYFISKKNRQRLLLGMSGTSIFVTRRTSLLQKYFGKIVGFN